MKQSKNSMKRICKREKEICDSHLELSAKRDETTHFIFGYPIFTMSLKSMLQMLMGSVLQSIDKFLY